MRIADVKVGTPASIVYPHDTRAAVVTHRTPKRITVMPVVTGPTVRVDGGSGDTPPIVEAPGILDRPIDSTPRIYTLRERADGSVFGESRQWGRVSLGESVTRTNYQNF